MTGRYLIYTPVESARDEKRFDAAWRKFAEVCRSLHRDGLSYDVQFNLTDAKPHVLVTASGTATPRKQSIARHFTLPQPVPAQRCRDRALEAEWFLAENRERRKDGTAYWGKHQARYQELSPMAEEFLRAESEYWRELELLSGQRQHFKPGLTDETVNADDEVAA
ncbi:MAG: hypothetical protein ABSC05_29555 [Candidatus Solibacter sp.]|jgi:hypothetical protein